MMGAVLAFLGALLIVVFSNQPVRSVEQMPYLTCPVIRQLLQQYSEEQLIEYARQHGATEAEIARYRHCVKP